MRLQCWSQSRWDIEFDPDRGSAVRVEGDGPRGEAAGPIGFADFERSVFGMPKVFAVFRSGDSLFFSAGAQKWRVGEPGLRLVHERAFPFLSRFRVMEDGRVVYSILYCHLRRSLFATVDSTYDAIDEETDFFLAFVAAAVASPEWSADVLTHWMDGNA